MNFGLFCTLPLLVIHPHVFRILLKACVGSSVAYITHLPTYNFFMDSFEINYNLCFYLLLNHLHVHNGIMCWNWRKITIYIHILHLDICNKHWIVFKGRILQPQIVMKLYNFATMKSIRLVTWLTETPRNRPTYPPISAIKLISVYM